MKKKLAAVCMAAVMTVSALTACGGTAPAAGDSAPAAQAGQETSSKLTAKVIDIDLTTEEYAFGIDKDQPEL
nr:amino acid ABC transporter substrate-binding protein [Lachnospiraceae bacterium]